jgi:hypothetical protein
VCSRVLGESSSIFGSHCHKTALDGIGAGDSRHVLMVCSAARRAASGPGPTSVPGLSQVLRLRSALREFFLRPRRHLMTLAASKALELLDRAPDPGRAGRLSRLTIVAALRRAGRHSLSSDRAVFAGVSQAAPVLDHRAVGARGRRRCSRGCCPGRGSRAGWRDALSRPSRRWVDVRCRLRWVGAGGARSATSGR